MQNLKEATDNFIGELIVKTYDLDAEKENHESLKLNLPPFLQEKYRKWVTIGFKVRRNGLTLGAWIPIPEKEVDHLIEVLQSAGHRFYKKEEKEYYRKNANN